MQGFRRYDAMPDYSRPQVLTAWESGTTGTVGLLVRGVVAQPARADLYAYFGLCDPHDKSAEWGFVPPLGLLPCEPLVDLEVPMDSGRSHWSGMKWAIYKAESWCDDVVVRMGLADLGSQFFQHLAPMSVEAARRLGEQMFAPGAAYFNVL